MKFIVNGKSVTSANAFKVDFFDAELTTEITTDDEGLPFLEIKTEDFKEGVDLKEGNQYSGFINLNGVLTYLTGIAEAVDKAWGYVKLSVQSYQALELPAIPKIPSDDKQYALKSSGDTSYWDDDFGEAFFIRYRFPGETDYLEESVSVSKMDHILHGANFETGDPAHVLWCVTDNDYTSIDCYLGSYTIEGSSDNMVQLSRDYDLVKLSGSGSETTIEERSNLHIIFNRYFYQKEYTVTLLQDDGNPGDEVYTGTVPADLNVYVSVKQPNATYKISCDNASKTVVSGESFGEVKSVNLQGYMIVLVDPTYAEEMANANVKWGDAPHMISACTYEESYRAFFCNIPNPGNVTITYTKYPDDNSDENMFSVTFNAFVKDEETTIIVPSAPSQPSITSGTEDLAAGTSTLATGSIYVVYE